DALPISLAPVRAMLGATRQRASAPRRAPRSRSYRGYARPASVSRTGPPIAAGRWSLLPDRDGDATRRAAHLADTLLERHGVITRGAAQAEEVVGGFALLYRVLSRMEEAGRVRRGYFVEHLGAAQFATPATVDRLRAHSRDPDAAPALRAIVLAASDPANPYGAALPWPAAQTDPADTARGASPGHRAGRKAGAIVVLVDGHLAVYLERGGKSALTFTDDAAVLEAAAAELAAVVRARLRSVRVERVNSQSVFGTPLADALTAAGFVATPQGLRLRV
ncbi:MAG: ATP-dependent helicase, partial [Microcella pacifica]